MNMKKFLASMMIGVAVTVSSSIVYAGDDGSQAWPIRGEAAPTPGPGEYVTDVDNENNQGTGTADGDMDVYLYNYSSIHPIEFNIFVKSKPAGRNAILRMDVYDIDASSGEVDYVYVNGTKVGVLNGQDGKWGVNQFDLPAGLVRLGKNTVRVKVDIKNQGWATTIDWGMITLSQAKVVTIDRAWVSPARVQRGDYINLYAEISGPRTKISKVIAYLGKKKIATLTDPDKDGTWSAQYKVPRTTAAGFKSNLTIVAKNSTGKVLSRWPGFTVTK